MNGDEGVNRRTCPGCGGRSYSACSGSDWKCPYCGRNLGDVADEIGDLSEEALDEETPPSVKLYAINGGKSE